MATKIEYRMEFDRSKKAIVVQGVLGGTGSVAIIDKRLSVKDKKDFDRLYAAFDEFNEKAHELVVCGHKADSEAETVSKCKGE